MNKKIIGLVRLFSFYDFKKNYWYENKQDKRYAYYDFYAKTSGLFCKGICLYYK